MSRRLFVEKSFRSRFDDMHDVQADCVGEVLSPVDGWQSQLDSEFDAQSFKISPLMFISIDWRSLLFNTNLGTGTSLISLSNSEDSHIPCHDSPRL